MRISKMNAPDPARLKSFLNSVLHGGKPVGLRSALFLDAICAQPDPAACISDVIASPIGLSSLQEAIHSDFSISFFNGNVTALLQYLQHSTLKTIEGGQFLVKILRAIVDPPIFWSPFVAAFRAGKLQESSQTCFAWLLLQLIMMPAEAARPYRDVAEDKITLHLLQNLPRPDGKNIARKIHNILSTATHFEGGYSPGGRHDNDFVDFREIAILPTADEIVCTERPFIRPSSSLDDPGTHSIRAATYLDNQFRLFREDMLYEIREEVQVILGLKKGRMRGVIVDGLTVDNIHLETEGKGKVFRGCKWGLALKCNVDLPQLKDQKAAKRKSFLMDHPQGKKILKHQSFVCLLVDGEVSAFPTINRDENLLSKNPPIIVLQFNGQKSTAQTLLKLKSAKNIILVQINTAVFSYEPVLTALQEIKDIPLSQEILFWEHGRPVALADHDPTMASLVQEIERCSGQDLFALLRSSKSIFLDKAQEASLLTGLKQKVSLIQGPPGTGKSFIGAILAKFLHDYSEQIILVVCYTNHALDQFLEDLLKIGIPLESIVRLGGKFNPRTEPMNIQKQSGRLNRTKADWKVIDDCKAEAQVHAQSLAIAFDNYKTSSIHNTDLMAHIEFEDPEYFRALSVPANADGMTQIGKKGRAVNAHYLFNEWANGKGAGIFSRHSRVLSAKNIWGMLPAARKSRIDMWKKDIMKYRVKAVCDSAKSYDKCQLELQRKFEEKTVAILRNKRIIGCTATGAAKYKESIQGASPEVLLVEEAGELTESLVITALGADAKQMILIGDHKQLRPKVNHYELTVEKGEGYDLNRSLFERLVLKGYPHTTLLSQHRMRPEISALVRHLTYPGLTDAAETHGRPDLRGVQDNIVFINHTHPEQDSKQLADRPDIDSKSSKQNIFEVEMILKIVRYLIQQGYKTEEIVVLTPYLGQLQKLQKALSEEADPVLNELDLNELIRAGVVTSSLKPSTHKKSLRLVTIDNYQGEESDIVVASLCRSNSDNNIGFMSSPERLNVLLSRARNALIIIGNANTFTNSRKGSNLWGKLLELLRDKGHVYDGFPVVCSRHPNRTALLKTPADFNTECPVGGCNSPCGTKLCCDIHTCLLKCHPTTLVNHAQIRCQQIIEEHCPKGHPQSRKCYQPSLPCKNCEREVAQAEEKRRKEFELQQKKESQLAEHERRLKDLQDKIDAEVEIIKDAQVAQQRAQALQQKQKDLKEAQNQAASAVAVASSFFPFLPSFSFLALQPSQANPFSNNSTSAPPTPNTIPATPSHLPPNPPPQRSPTPPGNPATANASSPEAEWARQKNVEGANNAAIDAVMDMIGLEDVKKQILRIKDKIEVTQRQSTSLKNERFNVVFLGNPGTGKTTVARQYAKFLTSQKILPGYAFVETTGARLADEGVKGAQKLIDQALNAGGGAVFIDEAYQLTSQYGHSVSQGGQVLDFLLAEMENQVGTLVFILAGYSKQMEKFFEHNPGLPSRVPYTLKFTDYTDDELLSMLARSICKKYKGQMKVENGIKGLYSRIAVRRLAQGRGREGFGNARALENMFAKITERQAERISRKRREGQRPDDFLLEKEDIIGPDPSQAIGESKAWIELQSLTGLKSVKESVRSLIDLISINYHRELTDQKPMQMSLNRVFLGSPGTGKTTVGKLYGQILSDIGMLSNGEVVVKNPADFVGAYIGHSEENTKKILASTIGKVLIIDEAYMLYGGRNGHGTDSFKTAVIDTIVAEVQNVPGEDRCVLLLGYEKQMREMFQNVNEGLSRRFQIEEAFKFEDFTNPELLEILESKLKTQDLSATNVAKNVAMELLGRERNRPNFGNGGAVENLLGNAKSRYTARIRGSNPLPTHTVFEPQDFDPEFDRHLHAANNLDKMFEDIVGCESIINKLQEYQKLSRIMKARGEDTRNLIPTNFVFKGPPGTGKTTIARKIGQVYYDMGFLSSPKVEECSASDLVGQYVGHTGPKTQKLFEKALGQVLFIDEAYRLGEGRFAQEAIDELVGLLTQEQFKSKIVVILAGYERDINKLLSINSGLSSRFPEIMQFHNFPPKACLEILDKRLRQNKVILTELRDHSSKGYPTMIQVVEDLSGLPSFGNARDMETLAKQMSSLALRQLPDSGQPTELTLNVKDALDVMLSMLDEQRGRSRLPPVSRSGYEDMLEDLSLGSSPHPPPPPSQQSSSSAPPAPPPVPPPPPPSSPPSTPPPQQLQQQPQRLQTSTPPQQNSNQAVPPSRQRRQRKSSQPQSQRAGDQRDPGVSNKIWQELQASKKAEEEAAKVLQAEIRLAEMKVRQAIENEERNRAAKRAALQAEALAKDLAARQEAQRHREELVRKEQAARVERQRLEEIRNAKRIAEERKKSEEAKVQTTLCNLRVCPQGYQWTKVSGGYRCRGGAHFVHNARLGI